MSEKEKELEDLKFEMKKELNKISRYIDSGVNPEFKVLFKQYCDLKGFKFIYDNIKSLPRMILTRYGIIELFKPCVEEWKVVSEINNYRALRNDFYYITNFIGLSSYNRYASKILFYLVTNEKELVKILNEVSDVEMKIEDIVIDNYINKLNIIEEKNKIEIKNKKENIKKKENYYIKFKKDILKVDENNNVFKLKEKGVKDNVRKLLLARKHRTKMQNVRNEIRA